MGEGYSIAWRTYDAQYWAGTPQRRKRIYLIADFASERAGEILFEQESVPGDHQPGEKEGQGTAENPAGGLAGSDRNIVILDDQGGGQISVRDEGKSPTLRAEMHGHPPCVISSGGFVGRQGAKSGSVGYEDEKSPTLRQGITTDCVYAIEGKCIDRSSAQNGKGWSEDQAPTINATDRDVVCYGIEGDGNVRAHIGDNVSPCMKTIHPNCVCYDTTQITSPANYSNPKIGDPCHTLASNQHPPLAVYDCRGNGDGKTVPTLTGDHENRVTDYTALCIGNGQMCNITMSQIGNTLDCMHDQQAIMYGGNEQRKYIIRRLTPLECNRLQGFPDGWGNVAEITELSDEEHDFWLNVRNTHAAINGKKQGKYTKDQMIRWLNVLHTDSAEYKMWGNGIALPCARDVIRRIAKALKEEP